MNMKAKTNYRLIVLLGLAQAVVAGENTTNRFSVSARAGFNIKASFGYTAGPIVGGARNTPNGDAYNYDDGYVLSDVSGNAGGQTWYWGYDDSTAQVAGNEILMNRTSTSASSGPNNMDESSKPFVGAELMFTQELEVEDSYRFGFDYTVSFMPLEFKNSTTFSALTSTTTDRFAYTGGTTPPTGPYQGTFNGPGFLISAAPAGSSTLTGPGAAVTVNSVLDGTLWGARIGPYMEFPVSDDLMLHIAGGMSLGILDVDVDWQATGGVTERGGGHDSEMLSGGYMAADLCWRVTDRWHVTGGAQFEYLNDWVGNFGGGTVQLDLTRSLYATLGIARDF